MKKNEKLEKKASEFMDSLKESESAVLMCSDSKDGFFYSAFASCSEVGAAIATILSDYFDDDKKHATVLAEGVLLGLAGLVKMRTKAGQAITRVVANAAADATEGMLKDLREKLAKLVEDDDDDDKDDFEDCERCDERRTCQLPQAIKYRKANGIHAPRRKSRKGGNDSKCN